MAEKLLLIDASSYVYRAFFALPAFSNQAGVPTHATLGFVNMIQKLLRESAPDYLAVVWDAPGPQRRKELYPEYKATRDATPEDLKAQLPWIRKIVAAYGFAAVEQEGEEADDVIATLTRQAEADGLEVEIASMDKDLMQLVGERVCLLDTMRDRRFGPAEVEQRMGVPPAQVLDLRALVGDSSDNIPGVKGIGEKGAAKLIGEYGTLDALLEHADEIKQKRPREALQAGADAARLSRELSRLREDLPVKFDRDAMRVPEPDQEALADLFRALDFKRLLEDIGAEATSAAGRSVEVDTRQVGDGEGLLALAEALRSCQRASLHAALEPDDGMTGAWVALAVACADDAAWLVSVRDAGEQATLDALRDLLEDPRRSWLGPELKRTAIALGRRGVELAGELQDTGLAAYVANPAQQVGRNEVLAATYLGRELPSADEQFGKGAKRRPLDEVTPDELAGFYGPHAAASFALGDRIGEELRETGQLELYRELEVPLVGVLARMEQRGVRLDEDRLAQLSEQLGDKLADHERRIYALAGEEFNIGSPKQLQHILFEKLELPPTKKTKTGYSTDESVLEELSLSYELPAEILVYRRLAKLKNTYVDALPSLVNPDTGRLHGRFNQTVAATGRLSSSHPNLQNIPVRTPEGREIRAAFIPAEGHLLLSADYSQIELRILAHLSRDEGLLEAFREGADIHVRTASQVFGTPEDEVSDEQRSRTKAINFGIIYGQGPFGLARNLGIPQAEAKEHIRAYFERYPGVKKFLAESVERARERGYAETMEGRRRYLPDLHSRSRVQRQAAERMATNSVIQGTAADVIKKSMVALDADLRAEGAPRGRMILQVHDELVFEVPPEDLEALQALVLERMGGAAQLDVPLEVHIGQGPTWLDAH